MRRAPNVLFWKLLWMVKSAKRLWVSCGFFGEERCCFVPSDYSLIVVGRERREKREGKKERRKRGKEREKR